MATLKAQLTFRVHKAVYDAVEKIAVDERRKPNEVARALLTRGLMAYLKDTELFEEGSNPDSPGHPNEIPAELILFGKKVEKKKPA